eukprot:3902552-Rhodomonas_salina.1
MLLPRAGQQPPSLLAVLLFMAIVLLSLEAVFLFMVAVLVLLLVEEGLLCKVAVLRFLGAVLPFMVTALLAASDAAARESPTPGSSLPTYARASPCPGPRAMQALVAGSRRGLGLVVNRVSRLSAIEAALCYIWPVRALVFWVARSSVRKITKGLYPAPPTIIDVLEASVKTGALAKGNGYQLEREGFASLVLSSESRALRS